MAVDQLRLLAPVLAHDVGDFGLQHDDVLRRGPVQRDLEPAVVLQRQHERGDLAAFGALDVAGQRADLVARVGADRAAGLHRVEIVAEFEPAVDHRLDVRQQAPEQGVPQLQPALGEQREAALHGVHRLGEVLLQRLLRGARRFQVPGGLAQRIQRDLQVAGLLPDLGLQRDGGLEQRIGAVADLVPALGPPDQRVDDALLFRDLDFGGILRVDHRLGIPFGRKKATPTKVWFTWTPRCCSP